jgi:hypothetical protein
MYRLLVLAWICSPVGDVASGPARRVDFARDVRPILVQHCLGCHGPSKQKGGLRFDRRAAAIKGGDSGPAIVPGKAGESLLVQLTSGLEEDRVMPPKGPRLSEQKVGILRDWIDQGADWPGTAGDEDGRDWWSLRPLKLPPVPSLSGEDAVGVRNPIDAFVRAKLREKGLPPSPEADRRTLIRRVSFDLVGLPPSPEEIDAFVNDPSPIAYEALVDRLLASPRHGERWARHWLDVVHYGDTHGYDKDKPRPNAWPYRDYVIRALSADRPYGRFVREQVAGDVLCPGTADGVTALGFIAAGPWDFIGHAEVPETKIDGKVARHLDRDDMVSSTINTFMSLTVQCAQCHDHKFDPIRQEDYYRLQADFAALDRADRPYYTDPAAGARAAELQVRRDRLKQKRRGLEEAVSKAGGEELARIDREIAAAGPKAGARDGPDPKSDALARLGERRRSLLEKVVDRRTLGELDRVVAGIARVEGKLASLKPAGLVYAGTVHDGGDAPFRGTGPDGGRPRPIHVLRRGDVRTPGNEVGPGALEVIPDLPGTFELSAGHVEGDRRAALARWLTDPRNPLVWRSIVNRAWQYHLGRGIVATANDFGRMGQIPTHPELLDWLAASFRDGGQSLKALHRLIVTSATYRQASAGNPAAEAIDAGNAYLWRMNRRKLEAEAVRDAALSVAGELDQALYGPPFRDFVVEHPEHSPHYEYELQRPDDPRIFRRAIYRFLVRSKPQPFMAVLDCADPSMQVDRRNETVSPLQALALYNNAFMLSMAGRLAARVESAGSRGEQVAAAFRLAVGRPPRPEERDALAEYARAHSLANACRVILNLNEFVFVD